MAKKIDWTTINLILFGIAGYVLVRRAKQKAERPVGPLDFSIAWAEAEKKKK